MHVASIGFGIGIYLFHNTLGTRKAATAPEGAGRVVLSETGFASARYAHLVSS
jgi:hypothetical protein